ncbi:Hypothetical protein, putative [Bodo saltans]|uniref:Uncharacterized protein n=1 Tax=Bodo saltans TaxID=75058 RepID=A0A0S4J1S4_BODSA|nr:Hypothetical protein, putative [Bodo saltans]|eukprot:CUG83138.1 Hypothetical protein, putative [Bodo saltans]
MNSEAPIAEGQALFAPQPLPALPPALFHLQAHPLETYLSEFSTSVSQQLSSLQDQLNTANATISALQDGAKASQTTIQHLQQVVANNTMQQVTKTTMSLILKKLAAHLNEMDPTYNEEEGTGGTASWLATAIILPAAGSGGGFDSGAPSPTARSGGGLLSSQNPFSLAGKSPRGGGSTFAASPPPPLHGASGASKLATTETNNTGVSGSPPSPTSSSSGGGAPTTTSTTNPIATIAMVKRTGAFGDAKLRNFVKAEIQSWYEEIGLPDAEVRHTRTVGSLSKQLTTVKDLLAEKVSSSALTSAMEVVRSDAARSKDEGALVKKRLIAFETNIREALDLHHERLLSVHNHGSARVQQLYSIFGLDEPVIPRPAILDSQSSIGGEGGVRQSTSDPSSRNGSRPTSPLRRRSSGAPLPLASSVSDEDAQDVGDNIDAASAGSYSKAKSANILGCTSFILLRQRILDDIVERISSSRHSQASDMGLEIYTLRSDLKQRPTTQRVLEMIGEQVNIPSLIARCDALAKQLHRMERDVVNQLDFNVALKTKADVVAMEQRISREEQEGISDASNQRFEAIEARMKLLMDERQELGKIFKEVVAFHKRDGGGSRAGGFNSSMGSKPPGLSGFGDDAEGQLQAILAGSTDPRAGAEPPLSSSRQGGARGSRKPVSLKPITEGRTQSQHLPFPPGAGRTTATPVGRATSSNNSGAAARPPGGTVAVTAAPSLTPLLQAITSPTHHGSGPALPFTTNQEAYARFVSEDQLRAHMEQLPPLPYERTSPR